MGSAIAVFPGARAIRVPRTRLVPVKTTADLLRTRSDATLEPEEGRLVPASEAPPRITLDARHYKLVGQLDAHFPFGAPSLAGCTSLRVDGEVIFGAGVVCTGDVHLIAEDGLVARIPDGAQLSGERRL